MQEHWTEVASRVRIWQLENDAKFFIEHAILIYSEYLQKNIIDKQLLKKICKQR